MSLDAGGLAQMTYNNNNSFPVAGGIGIPNAGYASRGKGSQLKPLNVVSPIAENSGDPNPTPRTSRDICLLVFELLPRDRLPLRLPRTIVCSIAPVQMDPSLLIRVMALGRQCHKLLSVAPFR